VLGRLDQSWGLELGRVLAAELPRHAPKRSGAIHCSCSRIKAVSCLRWKEFAKTVLGPAQAVPVFELRMALDFAVTVERPWLIRRSQVGQTSRQQQKGPIPSLTVEANHAAEQLLRSPERDWNHPSGGERRGWERLDAPACRHLFWPVRVFVLGFASKLLV